MTPTPPPARWKDLCVDAVDPDRMSVFWGAVLGLEPQRRGDNRYLTGPTPHHTVWINEVPEPVSVKQRVHLDVHAGAVGDVLALGATPEDLDTFAWKVLRDPEGGELCVFEREEVPSYRLYELGIDCVAPRRVAAWWHGVLGGDLGHDEEHGWWWVEHVPGMPFESLVFVPVPEPRTVKNRIHWDVDTDAVEALVAAGASVLRPQDDEISWTVLADPEGNEFCAFVGDDV